MAVTKSSCFPHIVGFAISGSHGSTPRLPSHPAILASVRNRCQKLTNINHGRDGGTCRPNPASTPPETSLPQDAGIDSRATQFGTPTPCRLGRPKAAHPPLTGGFRFCYDLNDQCRAQSSPLAKQNNGSQPAAEPRLLPSAVFPPLTSTQGANEAHLPSFPKGSNVNSLPVSLRHQGVHFVGQGVHLPPRPR